MKKLLLFPVVLLFVIACEEPEAGPVLLAVDIESRLEYTSEEWLFVTDKYGKVLAVSEIKSGNHVKFISEVVVDSVALTRMEVFKRQHPTIYFTTYTGIPVGSVFTIKDLKDIAYDHLHEEISISVSNYTAVSADPNRALTASNRQTSARLSPADGKYSTVLGGYTAPFPILLSGYTKAKVPSYMLLESGASSVAVDFNNFQPFPKVIKLPPAEYVHGTLFGHKTFKPGYYGYKMGEFEFQNITAESPEVVGYLENYAVYDFNCSVFRSVNDRTYVIDYDKRGQINDAPQILPFEFFVSSTNPGGATVTASHPYTYRVSYYNNHLPSDDDFRWQVLSADGVSWKLAEIPSTILEKYPNLTLETFEYSGTFFYKWLDGTTYAQLIDRDLQRAYPLSSYEYYTFWAFE
jgi:hypothetical protein